MLAVVNLFFIATFKMKSECTLRNSLIKLVSNIKGEAHFTTTVNSVDKRNRLTNNENGTKSLL